MKKNITKNGIEIKRVLPGSNSVLIIRQENNYIIVDSGEEKKWSKISDKLDKLGFNKNKELKALILTHSHGDHAGNAFEIKEKYNTKVIANKASIDNLSKGIHLGKVNSYQSVGVDIAVDEKMELTSFGIDGYIIHTPGHTMDSMSIILDDEVAITGDALPVKTWSSEFAITGTHPKLQKESCKRLLDLGCRLYICSHGKPYEKDFLQQQYNKFVKK